MVSRFIKGSAIGLIPILFQQRVGSIKQHDSKGLTNHTVLVEVNARYNHHKTRQCNLFGVLREKPYVANRKYQCREHDDGIGIARHILHEEMHQHLETILKLVEQVEYKDRLLLIAQDVGFLIVKTVVVGRIVEYSDVSEPEESEKQNEAARHLKQSGRSWLFKALG